MDPRKEKTVEKKSKNNASTNKKAAFFATVFGLVSGLSFAGISYLGQQVISRLEDTQRASESVGDEDNKNKADTPDLAQIAANNMPAVVSVTNMSVQDTETSKRSKQLDEKHVCSGVLIEEYDNELYIATNGHLVSDSEDVTVIFIDETSIRARVRKEDKVLDLAIVSVDIRDLPDETLKNIRIAVMGNSITPRVGDPVVAIGNTPKHGQVVSTGVLCTKGESIADLNCEYMRTDACINEANSGGPLLNSSSVIIGINCAGTQDESFKGTNRAIPIGAVRLMLCELIDYETQTEVAMTNAGKDAG